MEEKLECPFKYPSGAFYYLYLWVFGPQRCSKDKCALWVSEARMCAVRLLATKR